jgi:dTDP-L-rhamnose 4-epimerase
MSVGPRSREQLAARAWDAVSDDGDALEPIPTPEDKQPDLCSIYALTKYDQERMCLMLGAAHAVPTVALRIFNCFGPRQALSNPHAGVLASFASRLLHRRPPLVFEDGRQMRDFVSVHDVARACRIAYERDDVEDTVFNVGSGRPRTVLDVAQAMSDVLAAGVAPEVVGEYRVGDIRHCFADVSRAEEVLGYRAEVDFDDALVELAQWLGARSGDDRRHAIAAVGK